MIVRRFKINMIPGGKMAEVALSQYDSDVTLEFELYASDGTFVVESGTTAVFRGSKPDKNGISVAAELESIIDPETGKNIYLATVDVIPQMTAVAGRSLYELSLQKGGEELNTANFILDIERAPLDADTLPSESVIRELVDVIDKADEIIAAAEAVTTAIDDTLTQQGKAADAKKVGDEINDIKADLSELTVTADRVITDGYVQKDYSDVRVKLTGTETTGYLWNTTSGAQEANANGRYARFDNIGNYATLYLNGTSVDANHRGYAIYDSGGNRLLVQSGSGGNGLFGSAVNVPSGASYIIINSLRMQESDSTGDRSRNISIECYALKQGESDIVESMTKLEGVKTSGYAWKSDGTRATISSLAYIRYNTIPNSKYIYVTGQSYRVSYPLISFYNASDELIEYLYADNSGTIYTNIEVSIPSGTAYFIVNVDNGSSSNGVKYPESASEQETQADVNQSFAEALSDLSERIEKKGTGYYQYVTDSNGERICIWIPSGESHYIKYVFEHTVLTSINSNVWRIATAYLCDSNFNDIVALTVSGEWECALRLENRSDFSGGRAHGDEIYNDITFIIDGSVASDITVYTTKTVFEELRILQTSALYDPDNQSDKIADHMSEHVFSANSKNQCTIKQSVLWDGSYNIATCFLAMFPISKDVSDKWYNDFSFKLGQIEFGKYRNITEIAMNGYNDKIWSRFGINKYVDADYTGNGDFKLTDNSGLAYNKCYYTICGGPSGIEKTGEVVSGDVWQSESFYNFEYVE